MHFPSDRRYPPISVRSLQGGRESRPRTTKSIARHGHGNGYREHVWVPLRCGFHVLNADPDVALSLFAAGIVLVVEQKGR